jgi:hypothetical protein
MDFHSAVETFAEAWVAANFHPASDRQVIQVKIGHYLKLLV